MSYQLSLDERIKVVLCQIREFWPSSSKQATLLIQRDGPGIWCVTEKLMKASNHSIRKDAAALDMKQTSYYNGVKESGLSTKKVKEPCVDDFDRRA